MLHAFLVQVLKEILPRKECMLESFAYSQKETSTLLSLSGLRFSLQNLNHLTHRNVSHIKLKPRSLEIERISLIFVLQSVQEILQAKQVQAKILTCNLSTAISLEVYTLGKRDYIFQNCHTNSFNLICVPFRSD